MARPTMPHTSVSSKHHLGAQQLSNALQLAQSAPEFIKYATQLAKLPGLVTIVTWNAVLQANKICSSISNPCRLKIKICNLIFQLEDGWRVKFSAYPLTTVVVFVWWGWEIPTVIVAQFYHSFADLCSRGLLRIDLHFAWNQVVEFWIVPLQIAGGELYFKIVLFCFFYGYCT